MPLAVELVSPERTLFSGEANWVRARTVGGGDIAFLPPDGDLPRIDVERGAPVMLSLGDGSGLAGWIVSARSVGGSDEEFELLAQDALGVSRPVALVGSPGRGRWVLEATVTFDLERGSYDAYARVRVP